MTNITQTELWELRALIQKLGWESFFSHIGSILAEQADKVKRDSEQETHLFLISNLLHSDIFREYAEKCGRFDYKKFIEIGFIPKEYEHIINK